MSRRLLPPKLIFRKFPKIKIFENCQGPDYGLYRRKLIGYGVFRPIAGVPFDQTRPLDTSSTCVGPRVSVTEAEIQYLASVGTAPSVLAEAPTQRCQAWISRKFLKVKNFANCQGSDYGLYLRKLIGNGVFRSIVGVPFDQTRPLDTSSTCVGPRVSATDAEIQYLASVGRAPPVPAEAPTQ